MEIFTYFCPLCEEKLQSKDVDDERKCKKCKSHTEDADLYDGDISCKHEENKQSASGISCKKCGGWFCY